MTFQSFFLCYLMRSLMTVYGKSICQILYALIHLMILNKKIVESVKPKEQVESEAQTAAKNALALLESMGGEDFGI